MKALKSVFKALDVVAYILTAVAVGGMLFCVFLQVVARMASWKINWTTELSQYCFLWSTVFASYVASRRGKVIGVELIQQKMPEMVRRVMKFIGFLVGAIFYILVMKYTFDQLPTLMPQTTPILKWSMGVIYIIMMCGIAMLALHFIYLAFEYLLTKEQPADADAKAKK